MITPNTLLDQAISNYNNAYNMNYNISSMNSSIAQKDISTIVLIDSIAWVIAQLKQRDLLTSDEYKTVLSLIHSKDKENLVVAEQIIRNLNFKL